VEKAGLRRWIGSGVVAQLVRPHRQAARLLVATGLGLVAVAGSVLLIAADGAGGGTRWAHHSGASAAPLLLVAGAIAAVSVARPAGRRRALMRLVAVLAFTAWGLAQLFPDSGAAGLLNDLAILLFVVEAGCAVISDAGVLRLTRVPRAGSRADGEQAQADQPAPDRL
jgi:peptidoglycan/LPS O-acetylase OafA/YrhL